MTLDCRELEDYLRAGIPLSRAMAIEVRSADPDAVTIFAPLAPNSNPHDTVFGGSAAAAAILAAWSAVFLRMRADGLAGAIVIRGSTMRYERPITGDFTATARPPDPEVWSKLRATLARKRMARVRIEAILECEAARVGHFEGEFAVIPDAG